MAAVTNATTMATPKGESTVPKKSVIAAVICGLVLLGGFSPAAQAQQVSEAPLVPLSPSDMTPAELVTYQGLASDPAAQMSFRDTRAFLHLCQQAMMGTLQPIALPREPKDYDGKFLNAEEKKIVNDVLNLQLDALINSIKISN